MLHFFYKLFDYNEIPGHGLQSIQTEDVIPIHFIDQAKIVRSSIISYTFRYNDVLNVKLLHDSFEKLLKMKDWRKLSGRLRLNRNGKLEIRVPREHTTEHPVMRFSHVKFDVRIKEHPLATRLPKKTGRSPSIQEGCDAFRIFSVPKDLPNDIEHYLNTDEPLTCLHITSFMDATLVSITFPHCVADAMGAADLLKSWSCVLKDRVDSIPPVLGTEQDILDSVGNAQDNTPQVPYILQDKQIKGMSLLLFVVRFLWDILTQSNVQSRTIYFPATFISKLRETAQSQLYSGLHPKKVYFLSDGDLITAWISSMIISSRSDKRPTTICNVFDIRSRLDNTFIPEASYLQNLILPASVLLPASKLSPASLGQIALQLRQAIVEQTTDLQARALMRIMKDSIESTGHMPLFGSSDSMIVACTNWSKAKFAEAANLGPAVDSNGCSISNEPSATQPGTCVSYWGTTIGKSDNPQDTAIIYGEDAEKNYWVHGYLRSETWDIIQDKFDNLV